MKEWLRDKMSFKRKLKRNFRRCKLLVKQMKIAIEKLHACDASVADQETYVENEIKINYKKYSDRKYLTLVEEISKLQMENRKLQGIVEQLRKKTEQKPKKEIPSLIQELKVLEDQFEA